jgi:hypothetical protein
VVVAQVSAEQSAWVVAERAVAEDWASALVAAQDAVVAELVSAAASVAVVAESVSAADSALAGDSASSPVADSDKAWRSVARASLAWVAVGAADPYQAGCSAAEDIRVCDSVPRVDDSPGASPA